MSDRVRRIESPANAKVKQWRELHKRRQREASGLCLVEGARELGMALGSSRRVDAVLTAESPAPSVDKLATAAVRMGAARYELSETALAKVSLRRHPADVIGVVEPPGVPLNDLVPRSPALLVIADAVEKPGNFGAMIRTADGAGADGVIASDLTTDLGNPNVIRASQGAVFGFPTASDTSQAVAAWLDDHAVTPLVAADEADRELWDADLTGPVAIVIGSEDKGVSAAWRHHRAISIPMHGTSDSLNASVAAAVILYEAARQRAASSTKY